MTQPLQHVGAITLFVEDLSQVRAFYERVFDRPIVFEDDDSAAYRFENTIVNLLRAPAAGELVAPAVVGILGVRRWRRNRYRIPPTQVMQLIAASPESPPIILDVRDAATYAQSPVKIQAARHVPAAAVTRGGEIDADLLIGGERGRRQRHGRTGAGEGEGEHTRLDGSFSGGSFADGGHGGDSLAGGGGLAGIGKAANNKHARRCDVNRYSSASSAVSAARAHVTRLEISFA